MPNHLTSWTGVAVSKQKRAPKLKNKIESEPKNQRFRNSITCGEGVRHPTTPIQKDSISFQI